MDKRIVLSLFLIVFLLGACATESAAPLIESAPVNDDSVPKVEDTPPTETEEIVDPGPELIAGDCLSGEVSPVGQSIADDFGSVSYEQVINWFCNGAEYEDILVALETEALTEVSAEEMLAMLANGLPWEEIWQQVGLTE